MKRAAEKKEVERDYDLRRLAWYSEREAGATKTIGSGKNQKEEYRFKQMNDWYDYEDALQTLERGYSPKENTKKAKQSNAQSLFASVQEFYRKEGEANG